MNPAVQCRHLLKAYGSLVEGLDDSHRHLQPTPAGKTGGWLIGHLAVTGDFARKMCGGSPICPAEWRAVFNPGTQPSADVSVYPPMRELVERFREVYSDLPTAFESASPEVLSADNPFVGARGNYPTAGDFVAYLMAGHFGYHLGQLYGWRAAARVDGKA